MLQSIETLKTRFLQIPWKVKLRFKEVPEFRWHWLQNAETGDILCFRPVHFVFNTSRCVEMKVDDHIITGKKSGRKIIFFHEEIWFSKNIPKKIRKNIKNISQDITFRDKSMSTKFLEIFKADLFGDPVLTFFFEKYLKTCRPWFILENHMTSPPQAIFGDSLGFLE